MNHDAQDYVLSIRRWRLGGIFVWTLLPTFFLLWIVATLFADPRLSSPYDWLWLSWIVVVLFNCYVIRKFSTYRSVCDNGFFKLNDWFCISSPLFNYKMLALIGTSIIFYTILFWLTFVVLFAPPFLSEYRCSLSSLIFETNSVKV
jgi:hypothetical protein